MIVYADTSVFGGCFDKEFKEWSNILVDEFIKGIKTLMISELILDEVELARKEIRDKVTETISEKTIIVNIEKDIINLSKAYVNEGALTNKSYNDALHIALATINNADILTSWNFKHIVNIKRIRLYNSINLRLGYRTLEIRQLL